MCAWNASVCWGVRGRRIPGVHPITVYGPCLLEHVVASTTLFAHHPGAQETFVTLKFGPMSKFHSLAVAKEYPVASDGRVQLPEDITRIESEYSTIIFAQRTMKIKVEDVNQL